jgi:hypothetical protein
MWMHRKARAVLASLAVAAALGACDDDDDDNNGTGPNTERVYRQVERLGNPLVSEVTFDKRDHGFHNTTGPSTDVANGFKSIVSGFVTGVGGRPEALGAGIADALVPDVLIAQVDKPRDSAGWLLWLAPFGNGYGGRKLDEDVVDRGLDAIFGDLIVPDGAIPGLSSQNVPGNDVPFVATFPYLAEPHS